MVNKKNCLKGLPSKDFLLGKGIKYKAFKPPNNAVPNNGWVESSVNWEEDETKQESVNILLTKRKDNGDLQFRAGVARVPLKEIDRIIEQYEIENQFKYNEDPIEGNKYHGNLQFHTTLLSIKEDYTQVCAALARAVVCRILPSE